MESQSSPLDATLTTAILSYIYLSLTDRGGHNPFRASGILPLLTVLSSVWSNYTLELKVRRGTQIRSPDWPHLRLHYFYIL